MHRVAVVPLDLMVAPRARAIMPVVDAGDDDTAEHESRSKKLPRVDPEMEEVTGTRLVSRRVIIREGKLSGQTTMIPLSRDVPLTNPPSRR